MFVTELWLGDYLPTAFFGCDCFCFRVFDLGFDLVVVFLLGGFCVLVALVVLV